MNEKGENVFLHFNEQYFQLVYSAFSLTGKIIHNNISFESNPEDADYNYLTQRKKIIKQINLDAQVFIWETLLRYVFLTPEEFNRLVSEIPVFIKEEFKIEQATWIFKLENSIETINIDDLLNFSKKHHNYFVLVNYLWKLNEASRYEFIEEHKYLLKEDSHFIQLYAKNSSVNMTYKTLLKYEKYSPMMWIAEMSI